MDMPAVRARAEYGLMHRSNKKAYTGGPLLNQHRSDQRRKAIRTGCFFFFN